MKRQGYLIEKIAVLDNLCLAYYKAQKGKSHKKDVIAYSKHLGMNLKKLQCQILTGDIESGNYHYFTIYDPKKRTICAAPFAQRVLHHALMNVCHPYFERVQIFDSYASRPQKGAHAALERAKVFCGQYKWFLKLDFRKYFDSLDHSVVKAQIKSIFKDSQLLCMFDRIIDSYFVEENKGVAIGNLISQYFANHYLAGLDHFIKESLKIPAYVRYMDDCVLWHSDKQMLLNARVAFSRYVESELKLKLNPSCLNRTTHGLPFLGYRVFSNRVRLTQRSRTRFNKKFKLYENNLASGKWTQGEYQNHILPLINFTDYANARAFRQGILMGR